MGTLVTSNVTFYTLILIWILAADDVAVTQYKVIINGAELEMVDGIIISLNVMELSFWTDYDFVVEVADAVGNWSQSGPGALLKIFDMVDFIWFVDSMLTVSNF